MRRILVSACLIGQPVRYDGAAAPIHHRNMSRWQGEGRLVPLCPELAGGFGVPRLPAEIEPGAGAGDVLAGMARVRDAAGRDVTAGYLAGAEAAVALARAEGCRFALLKDGSPSCGVQRVHDGHFAGVPKAGQGLTALMLARAGVAVFCEAEMADLAAALG